MHDFLKIHNQNCNTKLQITVWFEYLWKKIEEDDIFL